MELHLFTTLAGVAAVLVAMSILTVASMALVNAVTAKAYDTKEITRVPPGPESTFVIKVVTKSWDSDDAERLRIRMHRFTETAIKVYITCICTFLAVYCLFFFLTDPMQYGNHGDVMSFRVPLEHIPKPLHKLVKGYNVPTAGAALVLAYCFYVVRCVIMIIGDYRVAAEANEGSSLVTPEVS